LFALGNCGKRAELWVKKNYLSNLRATLPNHRMRGGTRLEKIMDSLISRPEVLRSRVFTFCENFEKCQEPVKLKNNRNEVIFHDQIIELVWSA